MLEKLRYSRLVFSLLFFGAIGCSSNQDINTGSGAATGGAVGAGLGAIVGSATGDAGAGLVIGAAAGALSGAAMGNVMEQHNQSIQAQTESLDRQERLLAAQKAEIEELRRLGSDAVSFDRGPVQRLDSDVPRPGIEVTQDLMERNPSQIEDPNKFMPHVAQRSGYDWKTQQAANSKAETIAANEQIIDSVSSNDLDTREVSPGFIENNAPQAGSINTAGLSLECQQAADEVAKGKQAPEVSDKLFHYRRALRLCPKDPTYHNGLGEVYMSLDRAVDAEFEFNQALSIDPNYAAAKDNLMRLKNNNAASQG